jgi:xylulokinase
MDTILAIDIGTTGAKAAVVRRDGALLASALATYPTHTAAGGVVEQNPQDWWDAFCRALRQLWTDAPAGVHVAAVILSGQMQDAILLGDALLCPGRMSLVRRPKPSYSAKVVRPLGSVSCTGTPSR